MAQHHKYHCNNLNIVYPNDSFIFVHLFTFPAIAENTMQCRRHAALLYIFVCLNKFIGKKLPCAIAFYMFGSIFAELLVF